MKTEISLLALVLLYPAVCGADTRVTIQSHTDEYYFAGQVTPAIDGRTELWFGGTRFAWVTSARTYVLDVAESTLVYINQSDSTFAETKLPFDWQSVVSEETLAFLTRYRRHGTVEETGETRKIGEWNCKAYEIVSWIDVEDGRYDEREEKIWVSRDPPVDWSLYDETRRDILRFSNYEDGLIEQMMKIEGLRVDSEAKAYVRGFSVNSYDRVTAVEETTAPEGLYSVPEGFKKKAELTLQDLRG
jgi:hypothetical protein